MEKAMFFKVYGAETFFLKINSFRFWQEDFLFMEIDFPIFFEYQVFMEKTFWYMKVGEKFFEIIYTFRQKNIFQQV